MGSDRITELEIQVSHQAQTIEELSDEIHRQGLIIARLENRLNALIQHFRDGDESGAAPDANVKPPHW